MLGHRTVKFSFSFWTVEDVAINLKKYVPG